jgi:hypothetical protein
VEAARQSQPLLNRRAGSRLARGPEATKRAAGGLGDEPESEAAGGGG